uniref:KIB1-4 beta-propeller domain-containing protein n=1 Tax=Oryza punctata TaxID=4537 RepID=A0A0E0JTT6_ORYPU
MAAADWSMLPSDPISRIGDFLLAADDFDCYDNLRLVCRMWRSGTTDPTTADFEDARFLPKKLAMLELDANPRSGDRVAVATFVNLDSGRFLRKRVPGLRSYFFVAVTASGLVVLSEVAPPHETRVLNPFTGKVVRFRAAIHAEEVREVAVTTSPLMVFVSWFQGRSVRWADQDTEGFPEVMVYFPDNFMNLTPFAGEVYVTNLGSIVSTVLTEDEEEEGEQQGGQQPRTADTIAMIPIIRAPPPIVELDAYVHHLVESAGELLLVSVLWRRHLVHKVDTVNKVFVPVRSLGNRSIFVSQIRSFSVDADKFPTVEAGCVYFVEPDLATYECFHLADGRLEEAIPMVNRRRAAEAESCVLPLTLEQVMVNYCVDTENSSELEIAPDTDDEEFFLPEAEDYGSN